jgi:uncharacterized membrane protein YcaP (DUF421 family)
MSEPQWLLGGSAHDITWWQMSVRALIVFTYGLIVIRIAGRRAFGKNSAIDIVLAIIIGSSLSRTLTGSAALLPTLAAMTVLVVLHELLAWLCVHSEWAGFLVKGEARRIVAGGQPDGPAMRWKNVSDGDLMEALRLHGKTRTVAEVEEAWLERNGQISVITKA